MNAREAKALELAARVKITYANGLWTVPSQTVSGKRYNVLLGDAVFCSCEDFTISPLNMSLLAVTPSASGR